MRIGHIVADIPDDYDPLPFEDFADAGDVIDDVLADANELESKQEEAEMQPLGNGGASTSSWMPMLPPPVPLVAPPSPVASVTSMGSEASQRGKLFVVYTLNNGSKVKYYKQGRRFVAECKCRGHGRCFLTCYAKDSKFEFGKGRPLGYLFAWAMLDNPEVGRYEHVHCTIATHEEHQAARTLFWNMRDSSPELVELFDNEQRPEEGPIEPECMP